MPGLSVLALHICTNMLGLYQAWDYKCAPPFLVYTVIWLPKHTILLCINSVGLQVCSSRPGIYSGLLKDMRHFDCSIQCWDCRCVLWCLTYTMLLLHLCTSMPIVYGTGIMICTTMPGKYIAGIQTFTTTPGPHSFWITSVNLHAWCFIILGLQMHTTIPGLYRAGFRYALWCVSIQCW